MTILGSKNVFFLLYMSFCGAAHNLNYTDLQAIEAACSPRDTCAEGQNTFTTSNCACDEECHLYDDCCIDVPHISSESPLTNLECISNGTGSYLGVYAINRCQKGWIGPMETHRNCETLKNISDPLMTAPATDTEVNITYKNRFCAECNNANLESLRSWTVSVNCISLKDFNKTGDISNDYIMDRLTYRNKYPHRNKWGVYYKADNSRESFYPCEISFLMPEEVTSYMRFCRPNMISKCPANWRTKSVREDCEAFMAAVYSDSNTYRNIHCARCNNVNMEDITCLFNVLTRKKAPLPFFILVNPYSNRSREGQQCREDQIFDTFHKKCRTQLCAFENMRIVDGKCVKQS